MSKKRKTPTAPQYTYKVTRFEDWSQEDVNNLLAQVPLTGPKHVHLAQMLDIARGSATIKQTMQIFEMVWPLIRVPNPPQPRVRVRTLPGRASTSAGRHTLALAVLLEIIGTLCRHDTSWEEVMPRLLARVDDFLECLCDGLDWALTEDDDFTNDPTPATQPANFGAYAQGGLVTILEALPASTADAILAKPLAVQFILDSWALKVKDLHGRGHPEDYILQQYPALEYTCPFVRLMELLLRSTRGQSGQLWVWWERKCSRDGTEPVQLFLDTIVSRLRQLIVDLRCNDGLVKAPGGMATTARQLIHLLVAGFPSFHTPECVEYPRSGIVPAFVEVTYLVGEAWFTHPLPERLPSRAPFVKDMELVTGLFMHQICQMSARAAIDWHLDCGRAGLVGTAVHCLVKGREESDTSATTPEQLSAQLDWKRSAETTLQNIVLWCATHPGILRVTMRALKEIPQEHIDAVSRGVADHPPSEMWTTLETWYSLYKDFRKPRATGSGLCDNPTHLRDAVSMIPDYREALSFNQCSSCKAVVYCSTSCQQSHWKSSHCTQCHSSYAMRKELRDQGAWYPHRLRAWHLFLVMSLYRKDNTYRAHLRCPATQINVFAWVNYPAQWHPDTREISDKDMNPADEDPEWKRRRGSILREARDEEAREARYLDTAQAGVEGEGELAAEAEAEGSRRDAVPFPRLRMLEAVFLFGTNHIFLTIQVSISSMNDRGVDMEVVQTAVRCQSSASLIQPA